MLITKMRIYSSNNDKSYAFGDSEEDSEEDSKEELIRVRGFCVPVCNERVAGISITTR
jgi:hypothetical protein